MLLNQGPWERAARQGTSLHAFSDSDSKVESGNPIQDRKQIDLSKVRLLLLEAKWVIVILAASGLLVVENIRVSGLGFTPCARAISCGTLPGPRSLSSHTRSDTR